MYYQTTLSFVLLFLMKVVFATQSSHPSSEYDITTRLGDWINAIFEKDGDLKSEIDHSMRKAFASAEKHRVKEFEYKLNHTVDIFESKIIFYDINFYTHYVDADETKTFSLVMRKLTDDKTIITSTPFLRITLEAELRKEVEQSYASFFTTLHFENFVLQAVRLSNDPNDVKFSFDISYGNYYVHHHGEGVNIKYPDGELSHNQKNELTEEIQSVLPELLRQHIIRNPEFSKAFDDISKIYHQPSYITSSYPNFLTHRDLYYYFIPEIPFYGFHLRNVVMQGLGNIESFEIDRNSPIFTHTLLVQNIRGSMTLDYGCETETPLELNYAIGHLIISINENTDHVHVEAKGCSVNRTSGSSLTYLQSAVMTEKIESAVASSLMPSKTAWKFGNMESEIGQIEITNKSDWKAIKQSYKNWIPFNADIVVKKKFIWIVQRIFYAAGGNLFMQMNH